MRVGCPIRKFPAQCLLAAPRNLSQRATSFIASQCQGIHQMPFRRLILTSCATRRSQPTGPVTGVPPDNDALPDPTSSPTPTAVRRSLDGPMVEPTTAELRHVVWFGTGPHDLQPVGEPRVTPSDQPRSQTLFTMFKIPFRRVGRNFPRSNPQVRGDGG